MNVTLSSSHSYQPPSLFQPSTTTSPLLLLPAPPPPPPLPPPPVITSRVALQHTNGGEHFSDFEEEIRKHVQLPQPSPARTPESSSPTSSGALAEPQPRTNKKSSSKVITKRIIIRRTKKVSGKRFNGGQFERPRPRPKVEPKLEQVQVRLEKFPQFQVLLKADDVRPYSVLDVDVRRDRAAASILGTFYCDREQVLLVVTQDRVLFYQHHTNALLFQRLAALCDPERSPQSRRSCWTKIDETARLTRDEQIGQNRMQFDQQVTHLTVCGEAEKATMIYAEVRAQPLKKDLDYRSSAMSAVYLNVYYLSREHQAAERLVAVRTISLDTIVAAAEDISYTLIPGERSVVVCWNERNVTKARLGICKYNLSPDLETLHSVEEFQGVENGGGELRGLRWDAPNFVIGTGDSQISIWDQRTGALLSNIHLRGFSLGQTLFAHVLNVDGRLERHLLLVQLLNGSSLNVVHVNLLDFQYRVLKSRELGGQKEAVQSVVRLGGGGGGAENVLLGLVTRSAEAAQETLQLFDALTGRLVVLQRNGVEATEGGLSRLFVNGRVLVKLNEDLEPERVSIQSLNEFLFNLV